MSVALSRGRVAGRSRGRGAGAGRAAGRVTWYVVGACVAVLFASPLIFGLIDSLKTQHESTQQPPSYFPHHATLGNYTGLNVGGLGIDRFFLQQRDRLGGHRGPHRGRGRAGRLRVLRYSFRGSRVVFVVMLAAIMVPFQVLMVPMYTVLNRVGLTNSLIGVILVISTFQLPFATFVIQNSFEAIPEDLWEAAAVDGAGIWRNLRLALPLIRPGMITAGLFAFFTAWNEFFIVLVLLSNEPKFTLPCRTHDPAHGHSGQHPLGHPRRQRDDHRDPVPDPLRGPPTPLRPRGDGWHRPLTC